MNLEDRRLLRLDEVLRICAVSRSFVYREIAAGRFPRPVRVGPRAARWRLQEVTAWMDSRPEAWEETWR